MSLSERLNMSGLTSQEQPIQPHLSEDYLAQREQVWKETSQPGDIFNQATGEIKRNNGQVDDKGRNIPVVANINDLAASLVEEEWNISHPIHIHHQEPRRPLSRVRQMATTLLTSVIR